MAEAAATQTIASSIPSPEIRANITEKLGDLVNAIEAHPAWIPPNPHKGLYHVWDFVNRSRYIMTELDNIRDGLPLQYPEQIPKQKSGMTGPAAAAKSFVDVCSRIMTIDMMLKNPRLLVSMGLPQVNFGADVLGKSDAVRQAMDEGLARNGPRASGA